MKNHLIRGLTVHTDGITFSFAEADDFRENGLLLNRTLFVPADGEFADALDEVLDAANNALRTALASFTREVAPDLSDLSRVVEDEGPSPYDNPLERPGVPS